MRQACVLGTDGEYGRAGMRRSGEWCGEPEMAAVLLLTESFVSSECIRYAFKILNT